MTLRRTVPFDAFAWLLTNPETEVGVAPLADVPWLNDLPMQIRLKYLTSVNRWTHLEIPVALLRRPTLVAIRSPPPKANGRATYRRG